MESLNTAANSAPVESSPSSTHVVDRLLSAMERGDVDAVRACYAPDVLIWHNSNNHAERIEENLENLAAILARWTDLSYDDIRRLEIPGGLAQQHTLRGRGPDGAEFEAHIAMFVMLGADGRIVRVDEYLDSSQLPQFL
jgi:ketosteroid isomerase-like protein